jgi:hypothetical protein
MMHTAESNSSLQKIGMGRAWSHPPLEGYKAHVSSALLRLIGVKANANETVKLQVDFLSLLLVRPPV